MRYTTTRNRTQTMSGEWSSAIPFIYIYVVYQVWLKCLNVFWDCTPVLGTDYLELE